MCCVSLVASAGFREELLHCPERTSVPSRCKLDIASYCMLLDLVCIGAGFSRVSETSRSLTHPLTGVSSPRLPRCIFSISMVFMFAGLCSRFRNICLGKVRSEVVSGRRTGQSRSSRSSYSPWQVLRRTDQNTLGLTQMTHPPFRVHTETHGCSGPYCTQNTDRIAPSPFIAHALKA